MHSAAVVFDNKKSKADLLLRPGENLVTGRKYFIQEFSEVTSLEEDVLNLAAAIFACDLGIKRGLREGFTRKIGVTIPVANLARFQSIAPDLRYALYVLTNDAWELVFTQKNGRREKFTSTENGDGKVLLFSGGLDSLAAAVRFADANENVQLVSHVTANRVVRDSQLALFEYLKQKYPSRFSRIEVRVGARNKGANTFPADEAREETQRSRSLVFLALAAITARRRGYHRVVVIAENGQMAIHLPLTSARISAFSTHTAHPEFVDLAARILSTLLDFEIVIENPFLYMTKAEVVKDLAKSHTAILPKAISCWKASRVPGALYHCGFCIPCLIRRIAFETNGVKLSEYKRDLLAEEVATLPSDDDAKRNLMELAEFIVTFEKHTKPAKLCDLYPELQNGVLDLEQAVSMYQRFAKEARKVLKRYPSLISVLT